MPGRPFHKCPLKAVFWPPTLVLKQFASVLYFAHLVKWRRFPRWLFRHGFTSLPVAAGSVGMGCIGFPFHPAWEVTGACNLCCIHCHASSKKRQPNELTTDEARQFIDDLAAVSEFRMLVYTGGEPLMRPDLIELMHHSRRAGLTNVIATNGTLIDEEVAFQLREAGVAGAAVSLDSSQSSIHNHIRRDDTAYERAMRGIQALKKAGILVQINVTAMEYNLTGLDELIELADDAGSAIMLMYQLVPVGRGGKIGDAALDVGQNERLLKTLAQKQRHISTIIEPVAGPQYWPYLFEQNGGTGGGRLQLAEKVFHGCAAGRGFVYIKANGDVWPCPFVEVNAGNIREKSFLQIWNEAEVFANLRNREQLLKGRCGACKYRTLCGGCRGRAHAYYGDYLAEDPSCFLDKKSS